MERDDNNVLFDYGHSSTQPVNQSGSGVGESDANITRSDNRDNGRSRNDYDSRKSGDTRRGERRGGFLNTRGRGRGRGLEFRGPRRGSLRGRGGRGSDRRPFRPERSSDNGASRTMSPPPDIFSERERKERCRNPSPNRSNSRQRSDNTHKDSERDRSTSPSPSRRQRGTASPGLTKPRKKTYYYSGEVFEDYEEESCHSNNSQSPPPPKRQRDSDSPQSQRYRGRGRGRGRGGDRYNKPYRAPSFRSRSPRNKERNYRQNDGGREPSNMDNASRKRPAESFVLNKSRAPQSSPNVVENWEEDDVVDPRLRSKEAGIYSAVALAKLKDRPLRPMQTNSAQAPQVPFTSPDSNTSPWSPVAGSPQLATPQKPSPQLAPSPEITPVSIPPPKPSPLPVPPPNFSSTSPPKKIPSPPRPEEIRQQLPPRPGQIHQQPPPRPEQIRQQPAARQEEIRQQQPPRSIQIRLQIPTRPVQTPPRPLQIPTRPVQIGPRPMQIPPRPVQIGPRQVQIPPRPVQIPPRPKTPALTNASSTTTIPKSSNQSSTKTSNIRKENKTPSFEVPKPSAPLSSLFIFESNAKDMDRLQNSIETVTIVDNVPTSPSDMSDGGSDISTKQNRPNSNLIDKSMTSSGECSSSRKSNKSVHTAQDKTYNPGNCIPAIPPRAIRDLAKPAHSKSGSTAKSLQNQPKLSKGSSVDSTPLNPKQKNDSIADKDSRHERKRPIIKLSPNLVADPLPKANDTTIIGLSDSDSDTSSVMIIENPSPTLPPTQTSNPSPTLPPPQTSNPSLKPTPPQTSNPSLKPTPLQTSNPSPKPTPPQTSNPSPKPTPPQTSNPSPKPTPPQTSNPGPSKPAHSDVPADKDETSEKAQAILEQYRQDEEKKIRFQNTLRMWKERQAPASLEASSKENETHDGMVESDGSDVTTVVTEQSDHDDRIILAYTPASESSSEAEDNSDNNAEEEGECSPSPYNETNAKSTSYSPVSSSSNVGSPIHESEETQNRSQSNQVHKSGEPGTSSTAATSCTTNNETPVSNLDQISSDDEDCGIIANPASTNVYSPISNPDNDQDAGNVPSHLNVQNTDENDEVTRSQIQVISTKDDNSLVVGLNEADVTTESLVVKPLTSSQSIELEQPPPHTLLSNTQQDKLIEDQTTISTELEKNVNGTCQGEPQEHEENLKSDSMEICSVSNTNTQTVNNSDIILPEKSPSDTCQVDKLPEPGGNLESDSMEISNVSNTNTLAINNSDIISPEQSSSEAFQDDKLPELESGRTEISNLSNNLTIHISDIISIINSTTLTIPQTLDTREEGAPQTCPAIQEDQVSSSQISGTVTIQENTSTDKEPIVNHEMDTTEGDNSSSTNCSNSSIIAQGDRLDTTNLSLRSDLVHVDMDSFLAACESPAQIRSVGETSNSPECALEKESLVGQPPPAEITNQDTLSTLLGTDISLIVEPPCSTNSPINVPEQVEISTLPSSLPNFGVETNVIVPNPCVTINTHSSVEELVTPPPPPIETDRVNSDTVETTVYTTSNSFENIPLEIVTIDDNDEESQVQGPHSVNQFSNINLNLATTSQGSGGNGGESEIPALRIRGDLFSTTSEDRTQTILTEMDPKATLIAAKINASIQNFLAASPGPEKSLAFRKLRDMFILSLAIVDYSNVKIESENLSTIYDIPESYYNYSEVERIPIEVMADYFLKLIAISLFLGESACSNWETNLSLLHYRISRVLNYYIIRTENIGETEGTLQNIIVAIKPKISRFKITLEQITQTWDHVRTFHIRTQVDKSCVLFDQLQVGFKGFSKQLDNIVCKIRENVYRGKNVTPPPQDSESQEYSFKNDMKILFEISGRQFEANPKETAAGVAPNATIRSARIQQYNMPVATPAGSPFGSSRPQTPAGRGGARRPSRGEPGTGRQSRPSTPQNIQPVSTRMASSPNATNTATNNVTSRIHLGGPIMREAPRTANQSQQQQPVAQIPSYSSNLVPGYTNSQIVPTQPRTQTSTVRTTHVPDQYINNMNSSTSYSLQQQFLPQNQPGLEVYRTSPQNMTPPEPRSSQSSPVLNISQLLQSSGRVPSQNMYQQQQVATSYNNNYNPPSPEEVEYVGMARSSVLPTNQFQGQQQQQQQQQLIYAPQLNNQNMSRGHNNNQHASYYQQQQQTQIQHQRQTEVQRQPIHLASPMVHPPPPPYQPPQVSLPPNNEVARFLSACNTQLIYNGMNNSGNDQM